MQLIMYVIIHLILCLLVSFIGHKRRITGTVSFLLSATLSPIIGLIITLLSPSLKSDNAYKKNSEFNKVLGIISYCLSGLIIVSVIYRYFVNKGMYDYDFTSNSNWTSFVIGIGFYILGDYLYRMDIPEKPTPELVMPKEKVPLIPKQSLKQLVFFILLVVSIFVITNPSIKRFKEYKHADTYEGLKKEQNWGLFSFFEDNHGERFVGLLFNFFRLD